MVMDSGSDLYVFQSSERIPDGLNQRTDVVVLAKALATSKVCLSVGLVQPTDQFNTTLLRKCPARPVAQTRVERSGRRLRSSSRVALAASSLGRRVKRSRR